MSCLSTSLTITTKESPDFNFIKSCDIDLSVIKINTVKKNNAITILYLEVKFKEIGLKL